MKRTGIFILLVSAMMIAFGQDKPNTAVGVAGQANNLKQYQKLQQSHQQGLQKGAKINKASAQPVKVNSLEQSKVNHTSAVPKRGVIARSSSKMAAGRAVSQVSSQSSNNKVGTNKSLQAKPASTLSTVKPSERITAMKSGQNGRSVQAGAKVTTGTPVSTSQQKK